MKEGGGYSALSMLSPEQRIDKVYSVKTGWFALTELYPYLLHILLDDANGRKPVAVWGDFFYDTTA